ncbi:sulfite exporter TauE/SafE family protein [Streptomyces chiangmaiensis]|uniref:sulfite exporter TauE/SafE family protein n=1 Tax=Streptomyces chiangmaiensis TaxID=766497 RepID=UPI0031EF9509
MAHPLNFEDPSILRVLVGLAVALVIVQPRISRWIAKRREADGVEGTDHHSITPLLLIFTFLIGIYGGCFTAAQGVLMMAVMGVMLPEPLQRLNGTRNVLSALVNVVAGTVFALIAPINWPVVALLAVGSNLGGQLGAQVGLKLKPAALRGVIVMVGVGAMVQLVTK